MTTPSTPTSTMKGLADFLIAQTDGLDPDSDSARCLRLWAEEVTRARSVEAQPCAVAGEALTLRVLQDADSGWWCITAKWRGKETGILIAHPSLDVCVSDILPSWRGMAKLSPSQVPPVPPAPAAAPAPGYLQQQSIDNREAKARDLLQRCEVAFSAYIMGRRMARKDRDALRAQIQRFLG